MKLEQLKDEEMYVMVAPDGSPQIATMAYEYEDCVAFCQLLSTSGVGQSPAQLFKQGFEVLRVKVTIEQLGDADAAFLAAKKKHKNP